MALAGVAARAQTAPADAVAGAVRPPQRPCGAGQSGPCGAGQLRPAFCTATSLDPTGALIPGAQVTVTTADGKQVGTATANAAGGYQVRGLAGGKLRDPGQLFRFRALCLAADSIERGPEQEHRHQDGD